MEVPLGEGPQVLVQPLVGRKPQHLVGGVDLALDLEVPRRRRLLAGVAGARRGGISNGGLVFFCHGPTRNGVPASSKGNLISLRLLDFYRGGRLIASPCCADKTGLP